MSATDSKFLIGSKCQKKKRTQLMCKLSIPGHSYLNPNMQTDKSANISCAQQAAASSQVFDDGSPKAVETQR